MITEEAKQLANLGNAAAMLYAATERFLPDSELDNRRAFLLMELEQTEKLLNSNPEYLEAWLRSGKEQPPKFDRGEPKEPANA